ncbi:LLM class flavin-dependent oxidoreductase [Xylanimonas ulmi]|uniref:Methylenetetrahydromethanopterin reductase n=1 Tax=Xylanimonas ulmi TaxID=228973 RepID=A0A4Q7M0M3_9MICO|nr:LLM class flavin-dependent oxidoreductase [Xylanibacterium ulmi]RZS60731.1 methylenetetrahydromethanopterin reductase [Xylanibacterium ulmi]
MIALPRRGVWLFPSAPAHALVEAAVTAEQRGLDEFWLGDEGPARDPFAVLAAAAVRTSRIRLGVAVTNPYLRHPVALAAHAMTIDELSGGRFVLGLGPGGNVALGPANVPRTRPLATVREALHTVRAVTAGRAEAGYAPPAGAFTRPRVRIVIGSRSRGFQELASREADGVFLGGVPEPLIGQTVAWARSVRPIEVALYGTAALGDTVTEEVRPQLVMPLADSPPHVHEALGLDPVRLRAAANALAAGDAGPARRLVSDDVLSAMVLHGSPREIGRRLRGWLTHRSDSIGLSITADDPVQAVADAAQALATLSATSTAADGVANPEVAR